MEATGESVRRVTDFGFDPRWSPDGRSLVVADERVADPMSRALNSGLWVVTIADGERRRVAKAVQRTDGSRLVVVQNRIAEFTGKR